MYFYVKSAQNKAKGQNLTIVQSGQRYAGILCTIANFSEV